MPPSTLVREVHFCSIQQSTWRPTTEPNAESDCCEINPNTTLISPLPQVTEDAGEEGQRERERAGELEDGGRVVACCALDSHGRRVAACCALDSHQHKLAEALITCSRPSERQANVISDYPAGSWTTWITK